MKHITKKNNRLLHALCSMFHEKGFSLLELVVSIALFFLVSLIVISFIISISFSNAKTKAERETGENARRAMDAIGYELRSAKSVYTPTNTLSQLSLETANYLPSGETNTFVDFFLCGDSVCLKKESQDPIALTSGTVRVTNLAFTQILNGATSSVKTDI